MRTSIDIMRSLKRYVAEALGDEWEVRLQGEQGTFRRPAAQVIVATGQSITGPAQAMDMLQTFDIQVFPLPGETVMDSLINAGEAEDALVWAFRSGVGKGRAARLPIYDYAAVGGAEGSTTRQHPDFAQIRELEIDRVQNPSDELLMSVSAKVRLGWRRGAALPSTGRVARGVTVNTEAT